MDVHSLSSLSDEFADVVAGAAPSVVQVHGRRRPASGVIYGSGLVVSTARALGREDGVRVRDAHGTAHDAELMGWDPVTSLVLLRAASLSAPAARPATREARVGHLAFAVGRSWSNALTATSGIVSVIGGPLPTGHNRAIDRVIRTTAPMHTGFAGGALVDAAGGLMGVATAAEIRGLGVVIPADIAWKVAASLAEHGTPQRGFLGIAGQPVRLPEHRRGENDRTSGLLVVDVTAGSPADAGGILVGDVLLAFDGHAVESPLDLLELLRADRIGREATLHLIRGGETRDVPVTVGSRPAR